MQTQGGASQYGASPPEVTPFGTAATDPRTTHMLQGGVGTDRPADQLQMGDPSLTAVAEAASPISIRPPAVGHSSAAGNFEELLPVPASTGGAHDEDALGGDEADRGGATGGNRWPRQETLALLKIRSEMDAAFRDATSKGHLWEEVSRKLAELGYIRSAKKCKEKFENVHKYYKRTKEGRAGRQDGKSYRFFSQLEALNSPTTSTGVSLTSAAISNPSQAVTTAAATNIPVVSPPALPSGIGVTNPMPLSPIRMPPPSSISSAPTQVQPAFVLGTAPTVFSGSAAEVAAAPTSAHTGGISLSSDSTPSTSSASGESDDEDEEMEIEDSLKGEPINTRKRKRASSTTQRMMEFFEGLMNHVVKKQEDMQQKFLEAIEKREQDRMIREEAWKRQEITRLAREQELLSQERAMSASRDAAIINFLQKITGQTIQLPIPPAVTTPAAHRPPAPQPPTVSIPQPSPSSSATPQQQYQKPPEVQQKAQHYQHQQQQQQYVNPPKGADFTKNQLPSSSEVLMAAPEQQVPAPQEIGTGGQNFETTSSRWPKAEVLALINLRSRLESRYQEAGPKGPLWEEISAGMLRMGYKRNAKRCKEKWENINKYFKKVKESNKKRPEDAKTCPYYNQLEALYRNKMLSGSISSGNGGGASSSSLGVNQSRPDQQQQEENNTGDPKIQERSHVLPAVLPSSQTAHTTALENKNGGNNDLQTSNGGHSDPGGPKKPEDIVMEQQQQNEQHVMAIDYDKIEEPDSDTLDDQEEDEENFEDDDEDIDEEKEEEMKMAYKIQFQRQNTGSSNRGGNGAVSFLALVR